MPKKDKYSPVSTSEIPETSTDGQISELENQYRILEERYKTLFENIGDEVHMWKLIRNELGEIETWELYDANPAALKIWGKSLEEVKGKRANEIFGYEATKQFLPMINKIFETQKAYRWEEYFPPTKQYLSMNTIPLQDYFISTGVDITHKKLAEEALVKSEQKYRHIADNISGMVLRYLLHPDGSDELEFISKGVFDIYEVTAEEAKKNNKLLWDRVHKDDVQAYIDSVKESAKNMSHWTFEHRVQLPDGRIKWVSLNGVPIKQNDGSVLWDSVGIDITDKIESKERLEELNQTLEQRVEERTREIVKMSGELELYKLAAEQSTSGVWYFDLTKDELKWDDIMYKLYGIKAENFSGAFEAWESSLHQDDKERTLYEFNEAISGKKPFDTLFRIVQPETGKISHIRAIGKVEYNENAEPIAIYGTNWDVSRELKLSEERQEALKNLKEMQSQLVLSEKMASIGTLTAGVAHEINNPLNYILGGHKAINKFLGKHPHFLNDELEKYLDWIKIGAERATHVVKSLNLLSRNNKSKTEKCDLNVIISDCLLMLNHTFSQKIKIFKEFKSEHSFVLGNNGELHQVFLNILSNAINSISKEGEILIQTKTVAGHIEIIIQDSGHGIKNENLKKITEPFYTTKTAGKGTGLGLSIAKSIIMEHGGKLSFQSEVGKGTTVIIMLPQ